MPFRSPRWSGTLGLLLLVGCDSAPVGEDQALVSAKPTPQWTEPMPPEATVPTVAAPPVAQEVVPPAHEIESSFNDSRACVCASADCRCQPLRDGGIECLDGTGTSCDCKCSADRLPASPGDGVGSPMKSAVGSPTGTTPVEAPSGLGE